MNTPETSQTANAVANPPQAAMPLEGLRGLLAEDCPDQGRLYLKFLQSAGAKVALEGDGQSAVEAIRHSLTPYDAVVMDFQMPALDGLEATRQLRELGYMGTVVGVTAFGSNEPKQSWLRAGCDAFLDKPLGKRPLIIAITRQIVPKPEASELLQRTS